jgi:MtN3 and saliva related transmembrane protein
MDLTVLGLIAGGLTTIAFVPQMIQTWQTRSAKDVSFVMLITFISGLFLWLIYGILRRDIAIVAANGVTLIFNLVILELKIRYKKAT